MSKEPPKNAIPKDLLQKLNEFAVGGYLLTALDEEGNPEVYYNFDSPATSCLLRRNIQLFLEALEESDRNDIHNTVFGEEEQEDDD